MPKPTSGIPGSTTTVAYPFGNRQNAIYDLAFFSVSPGIPVRIALEEAACILQAAQGLGRPTPPVAEHQ